jgi:hypothetical protein
VLLHPKQRGHASRPGNPDGSQTEAGQRRSPTRTLPCASQHQSRTELRTRSLSRLSPGAMPRNRRVGARKGVERPPSSCVVRLCRCTRNHVGGWSTARLVPAGPAGTTIPYKPLQTGCTWLARPTRRSPANPQLATGSHGLLKIVVSPVRFRVSPFDRRCPSGSVWHRGRYVDALDVDPRSRSVPDQSPWLLRPDPQHRPRVSNRREGCPRFA